MTAKPLLARNLALQLLHYVPETGGLVWLARPREMFVSERIFRTWNARFAGHLAGSPTTAGYIKIVINAQQYYAHRLIWLMEFGEPVPDIIDHVDRTSGNNRLVNLRAATNGQNMSNTLVRMDNSTGHKGVKPHGRGFMARIRHNKIEYYLGTFDTVHQASAAYRDAAARLHGTFARLED